MIPEISPLFGMVVVLAPTSPEIADAELFDLLASGDAAVGFADPATLVRVETADITAFGSAFALAVVPVASSAGIDSSEAAGSVPVVDMRGGLDGEQVKTAVDGPAAQPEAGLQVDADRPVGMPTVAGFVGLSDQIAPAGLMARFASAEVSVASDETPTSASKRDTGSAETVLLNRSAELALASARRDGVSADHPESVPVETDFAAAETSARSVKIFGAEGSVTRKPETFFGRSRPTVEADRPAAKGALPPVPEEEWTVRAIRYADIHAPAVFGQTAAVSLPDRSVGPQLPEAPIPFVAGSPGGQERIDSRADLEAMAEATGTDMERVAVRPATVGEATLIAADRIVPLPEEAHFVAFDRHRPETRMAEVRQVGPVSMPALPPVLVELARASPDAPVSITLAPENLGSLKFEMQSRGDAVHVTLSAERPETLEMLKRHSDQLLVEFRQAGFSGASFSFSGTWSGGQERGARVAYHASAEDESEGFKRPESQRWTSGLDLRL